MIVVVSLLLGLGLGGAGAIVAGVWLLAGLPWALIAAGGFALVGAALLRLGEGR